MSVTISIHKTHRQYAEGLETVDVDGRTVGECLNALVAKYPGMKTVLFDTGGKLNRLIEIYLNMESAYPNELAKPTRDGDDIHVTLLLSGG